MVELKNQILCREKVEVPKLRIPLKDHLWAFGCIFGIAALLCVGTYAWILLL